MNSATIRPRGLGLREGEVNGLLFLRQFDALDLLQFLDPALHLLGLGRLVAEAVDEDFQLLDAIALVAIGGFELLQALGLRVQIFFVVAAVKVNPLVPDLDDLVDGHVEKIAVVRDQHKSVGIVAEIFLQPVAGFEIKMVGGLVQQQQVGLLQQQLDQRDAHLPAAGKFFGLPGPVFFSETQPRKHGADLGLDGVSVASGEFVLDALVALRDLRVLRRCVVELGHAPGQLFHLLFHGAQLRKDRHALGEHGAPGERQPILRQISGADALGPADGAIVEAFGARQNLQQGGFAGAVCAHQTHAVARRDHPVRSFEQELVAIAFAG